MRILDGEQKLVRIFIGERSKHGHMPLSRALVERLRKDGFAGVTVIRGIAGFGARSIIHTVNIVDLSDDLPEIIEVVDTDEHVEKLLKVLDEMVPDGLVTIEKVRVVRYAPRGARPDEGAKEQKP